ncbi:MAG: response regulator [Lachnospiraceae bacterium]|nr:response regulator [Lachnospiraceae bacterium]
MRKLEHYQVLLADDEYYLRESLKRKIAELDPSFLVACECSEGRSALEALSCHDIQVVFTDIRMPEMDGLALSEAIREQYPDVITVILTGYADFGYAQEALRQGVFDYLLKPVADEELERVLSGISLRLSGLYELTGEEEAGGRSAENMAAYLEQYMTKHYREEIDLGAVAEKYGFTAAYLSKLFTRAYGESPSRYLTGFRMKEAKRLLAGTDEPIARVGELTGYPDQFYFSRIFRKEVGENPTAYRKKYRGGG